MLRKFLINAKYSKSQTTKNGQIKYVVTTGIAVLIDLELLIEMHSNGYISM